jgi:hypothetical protein
MATTATSRCGLRNRGCASAGSPLWRRLRQASAGHISSKIAPMIAVSVRGLDNGSYIAGGLVSRGVIEADR